MVSAVCLDMHCPGDEIYQPCADSCSHTCRNVALDPGCDDPCVEGCACPPGQALANTNKGSFEHKCVPTQDCPCLFNHMEYETGTLGVMGDNTW